MTIKKHQVMEIKPEREEKERQIRMLTLEHGQHNDATLYRFEKGYYVQFVPGPSLIGRKVYVYTNYVVEDNAPEKAEPVEFVRNQYYCLEWCRDEEVDGDTEAKREPLGSGVLLTDTDVYCEIHVSRAGSFHYYFVYDNPESRIGPQGSGWFSVQPTLKAGGRELPADGVMCQTVLAKCLGPFPRWEKVLKVTHQSGYNMVHFTPVQELGASDSSYSLADQLKLNPRFNDPAGRETTLADVAELVSKMEKEWQMLSICDVVLNHTANETPWLSSAPEASYNVRDCPHLRPAALLDALLAGLSLAPRRVHEPHQVEALRDELLAAGERARLADLYACDADRLHARFCTLAANKVPSAGPREGELRLELDPLRRRRAATVDMDVALDLYNVHRAECAGEEERLQLCSAEFRSRLQALNAQAEDAARDHLRAAVDNCMAGIRYERLARDGPRVGEVDERRPLVPRYFTWPRLPASLGDIEAIVYGDEGRLVMAHNGWVMGADPLQDFADKQHDGRVYTRRELIAWGDSVKLRYGSCPADSPFLWAHMRQYVEQTAAVFHGLRLDNCHSTPLHVAEYMLDCARAARPDLYVVAELFTNSDHVDNIFVNRLGITSLIREAMSAWDAHEQGRQVHRFGGRAAGACGRPARRAPAPRVAPALLLDLTHDNPSPLEKRSLFDVLPSAALGAAAACGTGSTRGLDELVPHHIHVVDEQRMYAAWSDGAGDGEGAGTVRGDTGMIAARRELNKLHYQLASEGYSEVFVDQMDPDVVAVTRHHPVTRKSVIIVAHTSFRAPEPSCKGRELRPLRFQGQLVDILLEACLRHKDFKVTGRPFEAPGPHVRHPEYINGLTDYEVEVRTSVPLEQSAVFAREQRGADATTLELRALAPGAVAVLRAAPAAPHAAALTALAALAGPSPVPSVMSALCGALAELELVQFNTLLYCCDAEERARVGGGVYDVPGYGPLVYAGLQGIMSALEPIARADDLGHPLCANLRDGDWLIEYQWRRLSDEPRLAEIAARYEDALRPVTELPRFLVPSYFEATVRAIYNAVVKAALSKLTVRGTFAKELALTSVQLTGVTSALLPPSAPTSPPKASMSAGLPHFATGYMRCWGRDTFISLRGLYLLTGRFEDARAHILSFAACLRHGLIPNLLDGGNNARYNCRDAGWWWLQSIQQYCAAQPDQAQALLADRVWRLFPAADAALPLHDVMQEALDTHFQGLVFRERNAGRQIDAHMTDKGFNVQVGVDPETGFPFGGNEANCGTWMDKMGSSEKAGTRGKPATPRDGSAVELVALAYSTAAWLAKEHRSAKYPYPGVARRHRDGSLTAWTWQQWADRIRRSFERHFWIPPAPSAHDARPDLIHRRAIYKDSHGASQPWADYQLRCNFPIAMVVAPDLFDPKHAWLALDNVERLLLGPLGVKTLDPADWAYRGDYDNSNDSTDPNVAHGFNYHQGPEWVWPIGFYLRARLMFAQANGCLARAVADVYAALGPHVAELRASAWRGLPELTNARGAYCRDSCRSQAWSAACVLEALVEAETVRCARPLAVD